MNYPSPETIPHEWKPGDVILDLYEVRSVTEGHFDDQIEKPFHEGGFGRVYKVWHRSWQRHLAVKCPKPIVSLSQESRSAFQRECETWINLSLHPNVTACHYIRELGGSPRVFSEYADAGTLAEWIASGRLYKGDDRTTVEKILDLSIQFARGLHHAHESGIIHQDVKSLNALMWEDGSLKVTDFGIGGTRFQTIENKITTAAQTLIVTAGSMTPSHCSPEQRAGRKLDRRTDVWSWAVCVLEMFNGGVTWVSGAAADKALKGYLEYGSAMEHIPRIPDALLPLLHECLSIDPEQRPKSLAVCAKAVQKAYHQHLQFDYARPEPTAVIDSSESLNNRAISLIDLGRYEEAKSFFEQATKNSPSSRPITYNYNLFKWRNKLIAVNEFLHSLDRMITSPIDENQASGIEEALIRLELGFYYEAIQSLKTITETSEIARSALKEIGNLNLLETDLPIYRFPIKGFGDLRDMQFSWDGDSLFLLTNKVHILDYRKGIAETIYEDGTTIGWIKVLNYSRRLIAENRIGLSGNLIVWDADKQISKEIPVPGVGMAFELHDPRFLIVQLSYGNPHSPFAPSHPKIQTIDLDGKLPVQDVLDGDCGAVLEATSYGADIIVGSLLLDVDGYPAKRVIVWDSRDGRTLTEFEYDSSVNGFSTVVDQESMRLITSRANEPGLCVIDLRSGSVLNHIGEELGMVVTIAATNDSSLLLIHSILDSEESEIAQVSVYDMRQLKIRAILCREGDASDNNIWRVSPTHGFIVGELEPGEITVWRNFVSGSAPYLYLENCSYSELEKRQLHYRGMLRTAEDILRIRGPQKALEIVRIARAIPGFTRDLDGIRIWREIGAGSPKSGVRFVRKIGHYLPSGELVDDTFSGLGDLHQDGNRVFLASEALVGIGRILAVDFATGCARILLQSENHELMIDGFSLCQIGSDCLVFAGHVKRQFVICLNPSNLSISKLDRGEFIFDWSWGSGSFAMSCDGAWVAFGAGRRLKPNQPPPFSIWEVATKRQIEIDFDPLTEFASNVCFCKYLGKTALLFGCNLGIQVCSIGNDFQHVSFGMAGDYSILSVSECGLFVAHASLHVGHETKSIVEVFNLNVGKDRIFTMEFALEVKSLRLSRDGEILIVHFERLLQFYSIALHGLVYEEPISGDSLARLSNFSGDEGRFCIIGYKNVSMYEIEWDY